MNPKIQLVAARANGKTLRYIRLALDYLDEYSCWFENKKKNQLVRSKCERIIEEFCNITTGYPSMFVNIKQKIMTMQRGIDKRGSQTRSENKF